MPAGNFLSQSQSVDYAQAHMTASTPDLFVLLCLDKHASFVRKEKHLPTLEGLCQCSFLPSPSFPSREVLPSAIFAWRTLYSRVHSRGFATTVPGQGPAHRPRVLCARRRAHFQLDQSITTSISKTERQWQQCTGRG